jgi:peptide deformylase
MVMTPFFHGRGGCDAHRVTVRPIRRWGDPVLRTACDPVTGFDAALAEVAGDLLDTVTAEPGRAGLAANQIGVPLRVFAWYVDGGAGVIVNPVLAETSGEQAGDEGCLSLPGLWFPCNRAMRATVTGQDVDGRPVTVSGTGLLARCLQHEADHLDGRLFVDRLAPDVRREAMRAARSQ